MIQGPFNADGVLCSSAETFLAQVWSEASCSSRAASPHTIDANQALPSEAAEAIPLGSPETTPSQHVEYTPAFLVEQKARTPIRDNLHSFGIVHPQAVHDLSKNIAK